MDLPVKRLKLLSNYIHLTACNANGWDTGSAGQFDDSDNSVKVKNTVTSEVAKLTVCHELIHAIETLTGNEFTEPQVQVLGLGIYSLIKENKSFIKWLQEKEK